jgi:DNA/RNA endonuclease G (NUC1)
MSIHRFKLFFFLILTFNIAGRVLTTRADCLMPKVGDIDPYFKGHIDPYSCGASVSGNTKCNFFCNPGYTESSTQLFCSLDISNRASWKLAPSCVQQTCTAMNNIVKVPVYAKFRLDPNEEDINMAVLFISYDTSKKMPQYSIAHYDELNIIKNFNRTGELKKYEPHPCPELWNRITTDANYEFSGFDKGHLTPINVMRFSWKAARGSNLLINMAPQNHYINTVNWKNIEGNLETFLESKQAIVITGVCFNYYNYTFEEKKKQKEIQKQKSINVPSCFWKLVCYRQQSKTIVFGFLHINNLISTNNEREDAKKLRNQDFIRSNIGRINLDIAWEESLELLRSKNNSFANSQFYQNGLNYPHYRECARTNTFPKSVEYDFRKPKIQKKRKYPEIS